MNKKLLKGILYALGALAIVYIVINTDWKEVLVHISSISPKVIVLLLLLQCITILLLSLQWRSVALRVKKEVAFLDILMMNAKGSLVDAITPGVKAGGEVVRIYELKKRLELDTGNATIIVGLQKTLSLFSFLLLTLLSLIWFIFTMSSRYGHYLYIFSTAIALFSLFLVVLILFALKPKAIIKLLNKLFANTRFLGKIEESLENYNEIMKGLLRDKEKFYLQILLAVFIWAFYAFKLSVVMKGFSIEMDYISIGAITFLSYIVGMIPILPGSIGSFEGSMLVLLGIRGIPMEVGLSIAFVFRFATFWFEFIISFIVLLINNIILFVRKGEKNVGIKM